MTSGPLTAWVFLRHFGEVSMSQAALLQTLLCVLLQFAHFCEELSLGLILEEKTRLQQERASLGGMSGGLVYSSGLRKSVAALLRWRWLIS